MRPPNEADAWIGASITFSNAAGRLLTQIDFVLRHDPEIMIGLCMGIEFDLRDRSWFETAERGPRYKVRLSASGQLKAQERKLDFLTPYAPAVLTIRWPHAAISLG
jgi:hypothetical protein